MLFDAEITEWLLFGRRLRILLTLFFPFIQTSHLFMNIYSRIFKCVGSISIAAACFVPSSATAGLSNLPLTLSFPQTTEKFADLDLVRCANLPAIAVGMTGGTGTMVISASKGKKSISIPVVLAASDCPDKFSYFHNGKFTLMTANGQMLSATYEGQFVALDPISNPLSLTMSTGSFSITGGTGYFFGASGAGQLKGTETILVPPFPTPSAFSAIGTLNGAGTISFSKPDFEQQFNISQ